MIKTRLLKALLIGVCFSFFTTGVALAESGGGQSSQGFAGVQSEEDSLLFERQSDIDKYVFKDHAAEIEAMGFSVTYTGVVGDVVEVGILPYKEAYVDYLYKNLGSDNMKVIEGQENVLYSGAPDAPDASVSSAAADTAVNTETAQADGTVETTLAYDTKETAQAEDAVINSSIADGEQKFDIQITSVNESAKDAEPITSPTKAKDPSSIILYAVAGMIIILIIVTLISRKQKSQKN